jgi:hypothetical protein
MTWRILAPIVAAFAVVGSAVVLAAPGKNGGVVDPVAQAANTTTAVATAEFGVAGHVTAAGHSIALDGNGAIDMKHQRMRMAMSLPLPGLGSTKADGLYDGKAIYMRMPGVLRQIPLGKSWLKLDLGRLAHTGPTQANPADFLQALKAVGTSKRIGTATVAGVATTHYRTTIDPGKALDRIPSGQGSGLLKQMLGRARISAIPVDVWLDGSGRVRRESMKFSAAGTSMDMTVTFTRFGVPVDTTPPPADQVLDAGALLGS